MRTKKILAILLCFAMVFSTMSFTAWAEDTAVAEIGDAKYSSFADALAAVKTSTGNTITLLADVSVSGQNALDALTGDTLNLNGKTLTVDGNSYFSDGTTTFTNGNIVVTGYASDSYFCGYTTNAVIVFDDVVITGNSYNTGCALFNANNGKVEIKKSQITVSGDTTGGVIYGGAVTVDETTINATNVCRGITNSVAEIENSSKFIFDGGETGFNNSTVTVDNSEVSIKNATKRAVRLDDNVLTLKNSSKLTVTDCVAGIVAYNADSNATVNVDNTSTLDAVNEITPSYVAKIGNVGYKTVEEAFKAVKSNETITIVAGSYTMATTSFSFPENVTVIGEGDVVINNSIDRLTAKDVTFKNIDIISTGNALAISGSGIFENCKLTGKNGVRNSYANNGDVKFKNCVVTGTTYGIHFDGGNGNVIIEDCTVTGWTSFGSSLTSVTITGTIFEKGNYNVLRFYQNADVESCTFNEDMRIDAGNGGAGYEGITIEFTDCSVDGDTDLEDLVASEIITKSNVIIDGEKLEENPGTLPNAEVLDLGAMTISDYDIYNGSLVDGGEPIDLQVAMEFIAKDTPEEAAANAFGNYTTDFFITLDGMSGDSISGNGCYLAGNYGAFGWIMIPLDGMEIEKGKTYPVITSVGLNFEYVDICTSVKDFKCGIYFSDDVISQNPDMTVKLELGLSEKIEDAQAADYITVDKPYIYAVSNFGKVAQVGETTYSTLEAAIANANGAEIKMLSTVSLSAPIKIAKDETVTIDLNGKSILYSSDVLGETMITNNGTLTINDASNEGTILYTYTGDPDSAYSKGNYTVDNRGSMTINGGTIEISAKGCDGKFSHALYAVENYSGFDLTINGGRVYNANNVAIRAFGAGDIVVNDGEIEGLRAIWLQLPSSDASVAPVVNLTVDGGTLTGTGNGESNNNKLAVYSYSYGNDMKNVAINISGGTFNGDVALTGGSNKSNIETVTVTGGTFNGKYGDLYSYGEDGAAADAITITGGTFASDYAKIYCEDDGFAFEKNADNSYGVVEKSPFETFKHGGVFDGIGKLSFNAKYLNFSTVDDITYGMYIYVENSGATNGIKLEGGNKLTQEWFHAVVDEIAQENYGQNVMCLPYITVNGRTVFGSVMVSNVNQFLQ